MKYLIITIGLVVLLSALLVGWTILDGVEQGQRGGKIYPDNTPTIGPHHWDPPMTGQTVKGYQNSELTIKQISVACFPVRLPTTVWYQW